VFVWALFQPPGGVGGRAQPALASVGHAMDRVGPPLAGGTDVWRGRARQGNEYAGGGGVGAVGGAVARHLDAGGGAGDGGGTAAGSLGRNALVVAGVIVGRCR